MTDSSNVETYEPHVQRVLNTREDTRHYYNKIAKFYDALSEQSEGPMKRLGLERLAVQPGEQVLEIGFGTGHSLVALAEAVGPAGKVHGLDISDQMVALAQQRLAEAGYADRVELQRADAEHLPFADDTLDAIYFSFTLELFDTPQIPIVLGECRRVLRPGGRIAVVAVSREGEGAAIKVYEWTHKHFPNLLDCRPIYVERALDAAGFATQSRSLESMWVPVEVVVARKS